MLSCNISNISLLEGSWNLCENPSDNDDVKHWAPMESVQLRNYRSGLKKRNLCKNSIRNGNTFMSSFNNSVEVKCLICQLILNHGTVPQIKRNSQQII